MKSPVSGPWLAEYRVERLQKLERENEYLRAEQMRLIRLLGRALQVAVAKTKASASELLDVLCALENTNPARPAYVEHRKRMESEVHVNRLVEVLRETR